MLEARGLTKLYDKFLAVDQLSFSVRSGEVLGLVGPNGAGKTSTLRCLAGIIPPSGGTILIDGVDLAQDPIGAKRRLHFFPDEPRLFDYLTVWQHLCFFARVYRVLNWKEKGMTLLDELELADKRDKLPGELSRGMKQKLAIACGFLHEPKVMFFDEPLTGLDPYGIRKMKDAILARAAEGVAVVLSSHLLHLLEEVCSHVLILKGGRKVYDGTLSGVLERFGEGDVDNTSLEDVFFRATQDGDDQQPSLSQVRAAGTVVPPPLPARTDPS
jgi:ABC-2 type transport system ATP-binding protein